MNRSRLFRSVTVFLVVSGLIALTACSGGGGDPVGSGSSSSGGTTGSSSGGTASSSSSGGKSSSSSGSTTSSGEPVGDGAACEKSEDCEPLDCGCSDGSSTSYRGCDNGRCVTKCPSSNHASGASCVVPGGCFCASGACEFSTQKCCATKGNLKSGAACSSDCECASGSCSFDKCF